MLLSQPLNQLVLERRCCSSRAIPDFGSSAGKDVAHISCSPSHPARFFALGCTGFLLMWIKADCVQQTKYFRIGVVRRSGQRFCMSNFLHCVASSSVFRFLSKSLQSNISMWICMKNTHNLQQGPNHALQLFPKPYFSHGRRKALKSTSKNRATKCKSLQVYLSGSISQYWLTKPWAKPTSWAPEWFPKLLTESSGI